MAEHPDHKDAPQKPGVQQTGPQDSAPQRPGDVPFNLGVYGKQDQGLTATDKIAIALTLIWLAGIATYFFVLSPQTPDDPLSIIFMLLAVFLPIAMIWIGASVVKTAKMMRDEATRLQASMQSLRSVQSAQAQAAAQNRNVELERRFQELAARQRKTQDTVATFATSRTGAATRPDNQASLALGGLQPPEPLSVRDFIGAMNFPEDENDAQGFGMLRRALAHPESGRLIRAAQDILTLMSQDGIYMDDLTSDPVKPVHWRHFAEGQRGKSVAALGGIHDLEALALIGGRMRSDPVYRDTAHHFLREFDRTFAKFATVATDGDIMRLATTRSACAFMLLGRASGTFD